MRVHVYTFHKSGSMFLFRYFRELAGLTGVPHFSANNTPNDEGGWRDTAGGFIAGPIRLRSDSTIAAPNPALVVLHMRDPIDVLISSYFSRGWTHTPASATLEARRVVARRQTIDEYCLSQCAEFGARYRLAMTGLGAVERKVLSDYSAMRDAFGEWNRYMCRSLIGHVDSAVERRMRRTFGGEFGVLRRWLRRPTRPSAIIAGRARPHRRDGGDNQQARYLAPATARRLEYELADVREFLAEFRRESRERMRER